MKKPKSNKADKKALSKTSVMPRFLCGECGWIGEQKEMKHEYDFGYDQSCCKKCGDVMIDNLHGNMYCEKVLQNEA